MRLLLVDDHPVLRAGVRRLVTSELSFTEVAEAGTAAEVFAALARGRWDLVVLDLSLPSLVGVDGVRRILETCPECQVLVYTMQPAAQHAVRALRAGARGYLTKDAPPDELLRAARRIVGGGRYISDEVADQLAASVSADERPAHERLSDREHQVLRLLCDGRAVKQIAAELHLSVKTVSTYRTRLLAKLGVGSTAELVRYALAAGLLEGS